MLEISKEIAEVMRRRIPKAYIVTCSKRKHGSKGQRQSGKTYYCPESYRYIQIINAYEEAISNGE